MFTLDKRHTLGKLRFNLSNNCRMYNIGDIISADNNCQKRWRSTFIILDVKLAPRLLNQIFNQ